MSELPMLGAYLAPGADPEAVSAALEGWFHETHAVRATKAVPAHVVAWAPRADELPVRARAAISKAVYAVGASEIWILAEDHEVLVPRLHQSAG